MVESRSISVLLPSLENTNYRYREVTAADETRKLLHPQTTHTTTAELQEGYMLRTYMGLLLGPPPPPSKYHFLKVMAMIVLLE